MCRYTLANALQILCCTIFYFKKILAKLQQRYIWGTMKLDMAKVLKLGLQCWRCAKGGPRKLSLEYLPRVLPGEVVAMDFFGPLVITRRVQL